MAKRSGAVGGRGSSRLRERTYDVGEVKLHVVEAGPASSRRAPVILLHGFPQTWWTWRAQLPALAAAGFHAVAPDLRGSGDSDRPRDVAAYRMSRLVGDVVGLARALGAAQVDLVGHDWGGPLAWAVAARHPSLVRRIAVVNGPHPQAFLRGMRRNGQALRSSYMLALQLPVIPERLLAARDHALLRRVLRSFRVDPVSDDELEPYVASARRGLSGGLAWYRAAGRALLRRGGRRRASAVVPAPALVLWGEQDPLLAPHLATAPPALVPHARVVLLPRASHEAHLDRADDVNRELVAFFRAAPTERRGGAPATGPRTRRRSRPAGR